jgi:hypothetical protein
MSKLELFDQVSLRVQPTAAGQKKIEDLIAKATTILVIALPLSEAQQLGPGMPALRAHVNSMAAPDLKKLLKLWDTARKITAETTISEMRAIAIDLLSGVIQPTPQPPPRRRRPR